MKPFSPLYFIRQNKARCLLLMFMIFLGFGAYLGGIYIYSPQDAWEYAFERDEKMVRIEKTADDKNGKVFDQFRDELKKHEDISVIQLSWYNQLDRKTVMGFTDGTMSYSFCSVDDFRTFCKYFDIDCDFSALKPNTMVASRIMADNRGLKIGDKIVNSDENSINFDEVTFAAVTDETGYTQYFIGEEDMLNSELIVLGNGASVSQMKQYVYDLMKEYKVHIPIDLRTNVAQTYDPFNQIFIVVIIFLAVILAVTVNAAFVGMYQRRELEFAVYRAIGISKKRIIMKLIGEMLCMDAIVLTVGGGIFFLGVYLLNNLVLRANGVYLVYYAPIAVIGLLLCNFITIVPLIVTRSRTLLRANVCDF